MFIETDNGMLIPVARIKYMTFMHGERSIHTIDGERYTAFWDGDHIRQLNAPFIPALAGFELLTWRGGDYDPAFWRDPIIAWRMDYPDSATPIIVSSAVSTDPKSHLVAEQQHWADIVILRPDGRVVQEKICFYETLDKWVADGKTIEAEKNKVKLSISEE
jgi:hypothetical protein